MAAGERHLRLYSSRRKLSGKHRNGVCAGAASAGTAAAFFVLRAVQDALYAAEKLQLPLLFRQAGRGIQSFFYTVRLFCAVRQAVLGCRPIPRLTASSVLTLFAGLFAYER